MGFTAAALPPSGGWRFAGGLILLGAVLSGLLALQSSGDSSPPLLSAAKSQRPEAQRLSLFDDSTSCKTIMPQLRKAVPAQMGRTEVRPRRAPTLPLTIVVDNHRHSTLLLQQALALLQGKPLLFVGDSQGQENGHQLSLPFLVCSVPNTMTVLNSAWHLRGHVRISGRREGAHPQQQHPRQLCVRTQAR